MRSGATPVWRFFGVFFFLWGPAFTGWTSALPALSPTPDPSAAQRLAELRLEIEQLADERDRLAGEEQGVLVRLDSLAAQARLLDARLEELDLLARQSTGELSRLIQQEEQAVIDLDQARRHLRVSVRLLQRAGPLARLRPLLGAEDATTLTAGLRAGHELSSRLEREVQRVEAGWRQVHDVREAREKREIELTQLRKDTLQARQEMESAIQARRDLLRSIRRETAVRGAAIEELARARSALEEILAGGSGEDLPGLDIHQFRGVLPMPVAGRVIRGFGDRLNPRFGTRLPHPGWDIQVPHGLSVRAPFDGNVVYADWMRGYGLLLVIDHGHGVHTVYAHLSVILVQTGRRISQGQSLGRVGDTGSLQGPYLYLEVRVQGKAADPADWFNPKRHL